MSEPKTPPAAYAPLAGRPSLEEQIATFIAERLGPALADLQERLRRSDHKLDLLELGHRAIALRIEISGWLAKAESELDRQWADQYRAVWEASLAEAKEHQVRALPAELLKARARERVKALAEAKALLGYYRDDLGSLQSLMQTGVRAIRTDETVESGLPGAQSVPGLWSER